LVQGWGQQQHMGWRLQRMLHLAGRCTWLAAALQPTCLSHHSTLRYSVLLSSRLYHSTAEQAQSEYWPE
jgi:hypothetical protein